MKPPQKDLKKTMDYLRLILASAALLLIFGALVYRSMGHPFPIDVNLVVTYLLGIYVMLTGMDMYLRKTNQTMGLFLMLCAILIVVLNMLGNVL